MHYDRIVIAAFVAAFFAGSVGGTLWMLVFGGRLIFLLRKRHRNLAIELDLTPLYWTRANFKIAAWLKARRFEELNDSVTERAARRLSDAKPILMLMGLAGIVAALYVVLSAR